MRRILTTVFLLLISVSSVPAQELRHTFSEAFRRPALDVALGSEHLWIADGYGLTVATRANPPVPVASMAIDGTTSRLAVSGNEGWVLSGTSIHRIMWDGRELTRVQTIELDHGVFDLVVARGYLYLATASGIVQIDTSFPSSRMTLATTNGLATSLATDGNTLVAADGDGTADIYNVEFPALAQKIGVADLSITGANRAHVVDGKLLVSNGRNSEIFGSIRPPFTSLALFGVGASAASSTTPGIIFAAGQDTTVRLLDLRLSAGPPAVVFEERLAPSDGTLNRIYRIQADANHAYLAAGDLGLQTYDLIDFGVPFPIVRSFVGRTDRVVDLGTGQIVATSVSAAPRLYTIESSGAVRQVVRWEDQYGTVALDHAEEVTLLAQAGTVRLVRPSGSVTGQYSFGAAVQSAVVLDGTIWVVLADGTLWRVAVEAGTPEKVALPSGSASFISRGAGRLIVGSFNDDGTTTIHEVNPQAPDQSPSITIDGLATSGAGASADKVVVATFRGLSLIDIDSGSEMVVPLGEGIVPRAIAVAGDEILVLSANEVQRRHLGDGSVLRKLPLLSAGLSMATSDPSRAVVGALDAIYTVDLETAALLPESLGRLREPRFVDDVAAGDDVVHLVEEERVYTRVLQNEGVASRERVSTFDGDLVGIAATPSGYCELGSRGEVSCRDRSGRLVAEGTVPSLDDATYLSIHSVGETVMVSLLEGCLGQGCRKRAVVMTVSGGSLVSTAELDGEIVALSASGDQFAVVTSLPDELRVYDLPGSSVAPSLVVSRQIDPETYALAFDGERSVIYTAGTRVTAHSASSLDELGDLLEPFDPQSGLSPRDQRLEVVGDRVLVTGRSGDAQLFRITGPTSWILERSIPMPGIVRRLERSGETLLLLTDFSIELFDISEPVERRRGVRP